VAPHRPFIKGPAAEKSIDEAQESTSIEASLSEGAYRNPPLTGATEPLHTQTRKVETAIRFSQSLMCNAAHGTGWLAAAGSAVAHKAPPVALAPRPVEFEATT